jgi:hypothetical protein
MAAIYTLHFGSWVNSFQKIDLGPMGGNFILELFDPSMQDSIGRQLA